MSDYLALDTDTLPTRLGAIDAVTSRIGNDPGSWSVEEVGDGNLNLVFIERKLLMVFTLLYFLVLTRTTVSSH